MWSGLGDVLVALSLLHHSLSSVTISEAGGVTQFSLATDPIISLLKNTIDQSTQQTEQIIGPEMTQQAYAILVQS